MCSFLLFINCHMESPMIIRVGCTPVRGDFMSSFLLFFICHIVCPRNDHLVLGVHFRSWAFHMFIFSAQALPAFFICHMESPNDHRCWVYARSWGFRVKKRPPGKSGRSGAPDGNRTRTRVAANRILSPACLPVPPPGRSVANIVSKKIPKPVLSEFGTFFIERKTRFERATPTLARLCSTS